MMSKWHVFVATSLSNKAIYIDHEAVSGTIEWPNPMEDVKSNGKISKCIKGHIMVECGLFRISDYFLWSKKGICSI